MFCGCPCVCVRCCGQDCPRAGIGRNNGARVSTRSNARKPTGAQQRPPRPRDAVCFAVAVCRACVAADKTVRAPGLAGVTERGFQPAATPENPDGAQNAHRARETRCVLRLPLVSCVRCCGQDCPRAGIGRNNGARVSTRSNARKPTGAQTAHRVRERACVLRLPCVLSCVAADKTVRAPGMAGVTERGFQPAATPENPTAPKPPTASASARVFCGCRRVRCALLRTRLSARRDWPE